MKTPNQKAWWLVAPVVLLVAFNAVIPLMAVVNYSVQETFGNNEFFFEGVRWFQQVMQSARFREALQRQILFTGIVLAIQVPLGVAIALAMPRKGIGLSICLVLMAMPLLIPYNVVGAMWNIFALPDIGRVRIVSARHGEHRIKLLVAEGQAIPEAHGCLVFDAPHTHVYADGWVVQ